MKNRKSYYLKVFQHSHVQIDQIQIALRSSVNSAAQLVKECNRRIFDASMHKPAHLHYGFANVFRGQFKISKESLGDGYKRGFRPTMEPFDCSTIDERRELTTTNAQCVSHRRHTQHNVKLVTEECEFINIIVMIKMIKMIEMIKMIKMIKI